MKTDIKSTLPAVSKSPINIYIGKRLDLRRKLAKLGISELASAMCLPVAQLKKFLDGSEPISPDHMLDFSRVLDISPSFFFEDMPEEIKTSSPRCKSLISKGLSDYELDGGDIYNPMTDNRILHLINSLNQIEDEELVNTIYKMVNRIASS